MVLGRVLRLAAALPGRVGEGLFIATAMILRIMSKLKKGYFVKGKFVAEGSELVKKLDGKPFAFVSISFDDKIETLKEFIEKEPMPWTHWFNRASAH